MNFGEKQAPKAKEKGELMQPILAELNMKPCEIRDIRQVELANLTEAQIRARLLTEDRNRDGIQVVEITEVVCPPGIIELEDRESARREIRVAMDENLLQRRIMELFKMKKLWKAEEISNHLDHPINPIKVALRRMCKFDTTTRQFSLMEFFHADRHI